MRKRLAPVFALALLLAAAARPVLAAKPLDEGRLDPTWFGSSDLEFRETEDIDYLWVRPGFSLDGRKLSFPPWPEPVFLGEDAEDRDAKDRHLARQMNSDMPGIFADGLAQAFGSRLAVVEEGGDVRVEGRLVDCSTGSTAAKFWVGMGAGAGSVAFDLKFVDAETGDLLAAIHHRSVSGTNWSTTDSKFTGWVGDMTAAVAKQGFERLYAKGDRARK